ncbi:N-alpha-acetyltransferase 25, NatB auxiliary subunit, partial [Chytridiales sp. JEL 0842]
MTDAPNSVLSPIFDAIDNFNNKHALSLCMKASKKYPAANNIKALKALCHDRQGNGTEALSLCDEIKRSQTTNLLTLQVTANIYRQHTRYDDIVALYRSAYNSAPRDEDICNEMHMALIRTWNFQEQQQVSVKMNKQFQSRKYYFWTAMSIYVQSTMAGKSADQKKLLVTLADRMMKKAYEENRLSSYEALELQLYLEILSSAGKWEEALQLLSGRLGNLCKVEYDKKKLMTYYQQNRKLSSLIKSLQMAPDDSKTFPLRGPYLAELLLLQKANAAEDLLLRTLTYVNVFGSFTGCFEDLKPYLIFLKERKDVLQLLRSELVSLVQKVSSSPVKIPQVKMKITVRKVLFFAEDALNVPVEVDSISDLLQDYESALTLGQNLLPTERQYGDDFLLLAAQKLILLYSGDKDDVNHVFYAACLLDYGLQRSKHNFHMTVLLIRLLVVLAGHIPLLRAVDDLGI